MNRRTRLVVQRLGAVVGGLALACLSLLCASAFAGGAAPDAPPASASLGPSPDSPASAGQRAVVRQEQAVSTTRQPVGTPVVATTIAAPPVQRTVKTSASLTPPARPQTQTHSPRPRPTSRPSTPVVRPPDRVPTRLAIPAIRPTPGRTIDARLAAAAAGLLALVALGGAVVAATARRLARGVT